jgi:hypothetical protein
VNRRCCGSHPLQALYADIDAAGSNKRKTPDEPTAARKRGAAASSKKQPAAARLDALWPASQPAVPQAVSLAAIHKAPGAAPDKPTPVKKDSKRPQSGVYGAAVRICV